MNTLDYLILFTVLASCVFSWLDNRQTKKREIDLINKWAEAEKETNNWIESYGDLQKNFNELNKLYQATKAELEQYKNHESETAKVFKPLGKKVTVSTDGAGQGEAAYFEVKGLDRELINDPQNIRYTFVYKGNSYLGYHFSYEELKAHPFHCEVSTEAGENVETFLEF